jgi:hypothetical protein
MIKTNWKWRGLVGSKETTYIEEEVKGEKAVQKDQILNEVSISDQLNELSKVLIELAENGTADISTLKNMKAYIDEVKGV